jgi:GTP-binding protein EngB required for normal cell division
MLASRMRLADVIGRWIGKVEIVLAGADEDLREGQEALSLGDPMRARAAAHRVLVRAADSPIGLALLADACEAAHLDAELALTLEELARRAPSRGEVWVRLGRARRATGGTLDDVRDAFVRALAVAEGGSEARRDALLELADLDLAAGDGARAELWLERAADDKAPDVAARRAEARLLRGDAQGARALLGAFEPAAIDGHAALVEGRARAMLGDAGAFGPLVRAMVLDEPGASEALSSALAYVPSDAQARTRVRSVVDAKGEQELARWRAAFARAEGSRDAARRALQDAVVAGDRAAARPLLDAALEDHDRDALAVALHALSAGPSLPGSPAIPALPPLPALPALAADEADPLVADARLVASGAVDDAARVRHPRVAPWADALLDEAARAWLPAGATADWPAVLARLDADARALADLDSVAAVADLAAERARPVRLAIVGEFNAGKSTFINALIGADVAPTGVLPTTATLHHLRWAPDRFARISFAPGHEPPERIVALDALRATLKELDDARSGPGSGEAGDLPSIIRRVELLLPLPFLVRVEILDTPGFNAPDPRHTEVARGAFEEADAAIWLLDATQPMKASERAVLEEAKRVALPVQMLVNKTDRLAPDGVAKVMATVNEALAETGLASWAPPLGLSAKKALAGKMGDEKALAASGWQAVQALLDERIVARADELKERALRRRAARIVARLKAQAEGEATRRREEDAEQAAQAHAVRQAAARVERDADEVSEALAKSLEPHAQRWARDLALVFVGRDRASLAADPVLGRYRVDRALAALAPALARALASLVPEARLTPAQLAPVARALVHATVSAAAPTPDAVLPPLARAAVATLVEQLFAPPASPDAPTRTVAMLRELTALAKALA